MVNDQWLPVIPGVSARSAGYRVTDPSRRTASESDRDDDEGHSQAMGASLLGGPAHPGSAALRLHPGVGLFILALETHASFHYMCPIPTQWVSYLWFTNVNTEHQRADR